MNIYALNKGSIELARDENVFRSTKHQKCECNTRMYIDFI